LPFALLLFVLRLFELRLLVPRLFEFRVFELDRRFVVDDLPACAIVRFLSF
jgi:hypothetical protein